MKVEENLIQEISSIMKLKFSEKETDELKEEINETLSMLETIGEVDTEGVEGTYYGAVNREASFRKDEAVKDEEEVAALLETAPDSADNLIRVPAILDNGEGGA